MRQTFPTLAEAPRATWPGSLHVVPPDPRIEGDVERIRCSCYRLVPATELLDFRALPDAVRAALRLDATILCAACFDLAGVHGRLLHSRVAAALGLHPAVRDALADGERRAVARGHHAKTAVNVHLLDAVTDVTRGGPP